MTHYNSIFHSILRLSIILFFCLIPSLGYSTTLTPIKKFATPPPKLQLAIIPLFPLPLGEGIRKSRHKEQNTGRHDLSMGCYYPTDIIKITHEALKHIGHQHHYKVKFYPVDQVPKKYHHILMGSIQAFNFCRTGPNVIIKFKLIDGKSGRYVQDITINNNQKNMAFMSYQLAGNGQAQIVNTQTLKTFLNKATYEAVNDLYSYLNRINEFPHAK
jgi:hypothetical protein